MTRSPDTASWHRAGMVVPRSTATPAHVGSVAGDPCIVWDDEIAGWRMFLFYDPPGHAQAVCRNPKQVGPGYWELLGPLLFANPEVLPGKSALKPWLIMDAHRPNRPALIEGTYKLLCVSHLNGQKAVYKASSPTLAGPWEVEAQPLIVPGNQNAFDARHIDAVSGFYFPEREEILYFYMGCPSARQERLVSPFGSAQGAAVQRLGDKACPKLGEILPPSQEPGHWAAGWVGGLQLWPNPSGGWLGLVNASPAAPAPGHTGAIGEEPAPSLGGWASTPETWPVAGWQFHQNPIERVEEIPETAFQKGEGFNLWRHHALDLGDGGLGLFYNSGPYRQEQLYLKLSRPL